MDGLDGGNFMSPPLTPEPFLQNGVSVPFTVSVHQNRTPRVVSLNPHPPHSVAFTDSGRSPRRRSCHPFHPGTSPAPADPSLGPAQNVECPLRGRDRESRSPLPGIRTPRTECRPSVRGRDWSPLPVLPTMRSFESDSSGLDSRRDQGRRDL